MSDTQLSTQPPAQRIPVAFDDHGVKISSLDEMARFCLAIHKSGLAPKQFGSPDAIMVAVQMGLEIGLSPMQALQSIAVINGRPSLWGDAVLALASSDPDFEDIIEEMNEAKTEAKCTVKRKGRTPVIRTFSVEDAKRAQLLGKAGPWTQYQSRMLQMRARAFAIRDSFPEKLRGIGIREEQQDIEPKPAKATVVDIKFAGDEPPEPPRDTLALEG